MIKSYTEANEGFCRSALFAWFPSVIHQTSLAQMDVDQVSTAGEKGQRQHPKNETNAKFKFLNPPNLRVAWF